jgi:hypothetical protein
MPKLVLVLSRINGRDSDSLPPRDPRPNSSRRSSCAGQFLHDDARSRSSLPRDYGPLSPVVSRSTAVKRVHAREGSVHPQSVLTSTVRLRVLSLLGREHFAPQ